MTRRASCCVPLCTINFRNSPSLAYYRTPKTRRIQREYVRLLWKANLKLNSDSILLSGFSQGVESPQAHLLPSASRFYVFFFFQFHLPFCYFELFKHSTSLSAMFVYIRVSPYDPINARAPSLGRYHSFQKL